MIGRPNKITRANAGGLYERPILTRWAARIAQFLREIPMRCRPSILIALGLVLSLVLAFAWVCGISPYEMTHTAMVETFVRINQYAEVHRSLPPSLDVLPKRDGYANRTTDGWNRPLRYRVTSNGVITLQSFGADGKPGGSGENADIVQSYLSRRIDGSLWVGSPTWIVEAELK
jgi:hypothetical protein